MSTEKRIEKLEAMVQALKQRTSNLPARWGKTKSTGSAVLVKLTEDAYTTMAGTATANKCGNDGVELSPAQSLEVDVSAFAAPSFGYAYVGHYLWVIKFGDNYRPVHVADQAILGKTDASLAADATGTISVYYDGSTETDTGVNITGRNGKTINTTIDSGTFVDMTLRKGVWIVDGRRCT